MEDWREAWQFAAAVIVMGDIIERGVADAYAEHFKGMCENYPTAWWVCAQADWEYRMEFCVEEKRRQEDFAAQHECRCAAPKSLVPCSHEAATTVVAVRSDI